MYRFQVIAMTYDSGKLNQRIEFVKDVSKRVNGLPGQVVPETQYACWAAVEEMRESDTMTAINTQSKMTIAFVIRDPMGEYVIDNHHYVMFRDEKYPIKYHKSDFKERGYLRVYCEVVF